MTIERRYKGAFDVYVETNYGRTHIDTVFWAPATIDEVRRSLIDHDNYDSNITVVPAEGTMLPLTEGELADLCADNDVTTHEDGGKWSYRVDDRENSYTFDTERDAMLDAVAAGNLEEQTYEAIED